MSNGAATSESLKVQISRVIQAKRQRVYDAWTKPEMLGKWLGPQYLTCSSTGIDLRVGGAYQVEMQGCRPASDGGEPVEVHAIATGVYREIVPGERLSFTWRGNWDSSEETLVTVSFKDVEGGTEVTLVHDRFATGKDVGGYQQGWIDSLAKLAAFCEV